MHWKKTAWLIHGFALLHVAVTMLCTAMGLRDSLLLTALTMALTGVICFQENLTVEITVTALILVNVIGFLLGNIGAFVLEDLLPPIWHHAISTFLVTEGIGWGLYLFAHRFSPYGPAGYEREQSWYKHAGWLVIAIGLVFGIRVYTDLNFNGDSVLENSGVMVLLILTTVVSLILMVNFAINMQQEASKQRTRRHQAEFRYMNLKNQVNPHFLFNSLNILDSVIQEGEKEEASRYVHKLAGIYRYMLQHDGEKLVRLSEEVTFVSMYYDLLKIRFPEGISVEKDIRPEDLSRMVVPCTLQLLVENVTKHNAISPEAPVRIRIVTDGRFLTLENNRRPRASEPVSTGLGLPYIRKQYMDISGEGILVEKTDDAFRVRIPLL